MKVQTLWGQPFPNCYPALSLTVEKEEKGEEEGVRERWGEGRELGRDGRGLGRDGGEGKFLCGVVTLWNEIFKSILGHFSDMNRQRIADQ